MIHLLDRARGGAAESAPGHEHARQLLEAHRVSVRRVVAVDVDAILYVGSDGTARTAWLTVHDGGAVTIEDVAGFPAERPGGRGAPGGAAARFHRVAAGR